MKTPTITAPRQYVRSFVFFCATLGESAATIQKKLYQLFGDQAPQKTFIYKYMKGLSHHDDDNDDDNDEDDDDDADADEFITFDDAYRSGRPSKNIHLQEIIVQMLADEPFHSTRSIAQSLSVSRETVRDVLKNKLKLRKFKCKWIPYQLTETRKKHRVHLASLLHSSLENMEILEKTITGDQAWFYFDNPADEQWAASPEDVQRNASRTLQSKKVMVTILWGLKGYYIVEALPVDQKYNSIYFVKLLQKLRDNLKATRGFKRIKIFYLHLDNAKVHRSQYTTEQAEELGFKMLPHPPYSPDLAPSDFFLFGYIKTQLKGSNFKTVAMLMEAIISILNKISQELIEKIMMEWVDRLQTVISHKGDYIDE